MGMEPRHETIKIQQQTWLFWVQSDITKVGYKISKDHGVSNKREGSNKKNSGFNKNQDLTKTVIQDYQSLLTQVVWLYCIQANRGECAFAAAKSFF